MWGEIEEAPPATPASSHESSDRPRTTVVEPVDESNTALGPLLGCDFTHTKAPHQNKQHTPDDGGALQAVSSSVSAMLEVVAVSGCMVKSQQIGDAELTMEERREELQKQYQRRPLVFLERYQAYLKPKHLEAFSSLRSDSRAQHYCRVIQRRAAAGRADKTRVRNQRYAALRALQRDGQYFSEEQMRVRQPLLYEQYIGQYLTDDELLVRTQEAMQGDAEGQAGCPGDGNAGAGLAHLLLDSYQERLIQDRLQEEHEREEATREEDDDDDGDVSGKEEWEPTAQEKVMLREEFVTQMHQRFLDGKDKDFNYSEVDENPDYDNLDIVSRDAEDKYFDDDDEEEEEDDNEEEQEEDEDDKMAE